MKILGNPVSKGISIAPVLLYQRDNMLIDEKNYNGDEETQRKIFFDALKKAEKELDSLIESMDVGDNNGKIFVAHKEILFDEDLTEQIEDEIVNNKYLPVYAVKKSYDFFIDLLKKAGNTLIEERCLDLADVKNRLIRILQGKEEVSLANLASDVIVVAHDLLPSDTAKLDRKHVKGIITELGGETSHTAIIAKNYGIPALLSVKDAMIIFKDGEILGLNAIKGIVYHQPSEKQVEELRKEKMIYEKQIKIENEFLYKQSEMADGTHVDVGINIGSDSNENNFEAADYVGLFRTEFLYMENDHFPTEEEQFEVYKSVLQKANGKTVTLRTLDIGGDKTLTYYDLPKEDNPFLGKRALRLVFDETEIMNTQLRAALRASVYGDLWIMFPMVGSIDDIRRAKIIVQKIKEELYNEGKDYNKNVKIGIMIEIPSIALIADFAAKEVDFASIGSNDLCQYTCAVDRMNPDVQSYYQSLSPAMLRILQTVVSAFNRAGKPISICGELGGNSLATIALVGLGLRKLSMNSSSLAEVKYVLSKISMEKTEAVIDVLMTLESEAEIKTYLRKVLAEA